MSRRNNIKVLDLPEEEGEKTWADTEELVKKTVKEQLHYEDDVHIERAHRVGKPRPLFVMNSDGTKTKSRPRPIIREIQLLEREGGHLGNGQESQTEADKVLSRLIKQNSEKKSREDTRFDQGKKKRQDCVFYIR